VVLFAFVLAQSCSFKDFSSIDDGNANLTQYVNPLIGTQNTSELSNGGLFPSVAMPFGMNYWTPQTEGDHKWIYRYEDKKISGFRCTHQSNPSMGDYGAFVIMPITGDLVIDGERRASVYSHVNEMAAPYSYSINLEKYNVDAEMIPTLRGGMFKFIYPESTSSYIMLDALPGKAYIRIIPQQRRIVGFCKNNNGGVPKNFASYFVLQFDKPFQNFTTWNKDTINALNREVQGNDVGAAIKFSTLKNETIHVKVATSFVSIPQAIINLNRELEDFTFDQLKIKANQTWNNELNKIIVEGGSAEDLTKFYTSLYRMLLNPRIFYEFDETGRMIHYSPFDGRVHDGYMFTDISLQEAHGNLFPFFTLAYPELNTSIIKGLLNAYREGGWMPVSPGPGYRKNTTGGYAASIFCDAYVKGIRDFDHELAYQAMKKDALVIPPKYAPGREGLNYYNNLGFIPYPEMKGGTSKTLAYAYQDFCIWKLGRELNKVDDLSLYKSKAQYYQNVIDPATGFARGKNKENEWFTPFDPIEWGGPYQLGNAWQNTWNVTHDVHGFMERIGGKDRYISKLDSLFETPPEFKVGTYGKVIHEMTEMVLSDMGQYAHVNLTTQHTPYLYSFAGKPWETQKIIRKIMEKLYKPTPDGLSGQDVGSSLSSWFVFSAIGFYPVCPGTGEYVFGSPLFRKVTFDLENGNKFVVEAPENSTQNVFIESIELNGNRYEKNYINHLDIMQGGSLKFEMNNKPNRRLGRDEESMPFSLSNYDDHIK